MPQSKLVGRTGLLRIAALLTALHAAPALAQVFECPGQHGPSFQGVPCADPGRKLALAIHQPTPAELATAKAVARKELAFVQKTEAERERARRQAATERQRRKIEEQRKDARCARYVEDAERAEEDARTHHRRNRHKLNHERRARDLRDRHFSECFAAK